MNFFELARGPLLYISLAVFAAGLLFSTGRLMAMIKPTREKVLF